MHTSEYVSLLKQNLEQSFILIKEDTTYVYADRGLTKKVTLSENLVSRIYNVEYSLNESIYAITQNGNLYYAKKEMLHPLVTLNEHMTHELLQIKLITVSDQNQIFEFSNRGKWQHYPTERKVRWKDIANHLSILLAKKENVAQVAFKKLTSELSYNAEVINELKKESDRIHERYKKLRNSKLGKIQVKIWENKK
ncbi:hypothetical protein K0018_10060 [Staphylococcus massiliensis]|uniref:hypothetical protein n=1 Tax=Staphylococcus massiliensis TaxID=555791 RepID=UPI001EE0184C|nr:hypothetical protein [Staphylococcus massiliensis]MCG3413387.1 hypothetical protein [Staphylococcus massiliensis]